jgi:hypothetical protein
MRALRTGSPRWVIQGREAGDQGEEGEDHGGMIMTTGASDVSDIMACYVCEGLGSEA